VPPEQVKQKEVSMMPVKIYTLNVMFVLAALFATVSMNAADPGSPRQDLAADGDWKFFLGDPGGAEAPAFVDSSWRTVNLPHDWSIESAPEKGNSAGGGEGYFPAGIGWYRKTFHAPVSWKGKRVSVEFDGVYRDATVYLNGRELGTHPYGYTSFTFDLTPGLNFTGANVLAVRVDNSDQPNSRWYSGSGIYRHVRVVVTDKVHVAHWGVSVSTPEATGEWAKVSVRTRVANESKSDTNVTVETTLLDKAGKKLGVAQSKLDLASGKEDDAEQEIAVANPALWTPATPTLYSAVSIVRRGGKVIDKVITPFGIRTLAWSAEKGFLLNGKSIKFAGGSVHHDNGPLGAAAFDRAEERRVELLKAAGYNAVRTAHNPPSPAFLDACDRLGLLVLDETFDMWEVSKVKYDYGRDFDDWWRQDTSSMVMRDRNHPSIMIWGIGNEIPELTVEKGRTIAKQLADQVRSLDSTRPLTLAFPGTTTAPNAEAVFSLLDITGYNYSIASSHSADHEKLPSRIMLTTESFPQSAYALWKISQENPYVLGDFTWTAMDYLGESGIGSWSIANAPPDGSSKTTSGGNASFTKIVDGMFLKMAQEHEKEMAEKATDAKKSSSSGNAAMGTMASAFPWHAAICGDIDLTGYRKSQSYYRDILWNGGDRIFATVRVPAPEGKRIVAAMWASYPTLPTWTWPGEEGKELQVELYSGAERVELFLNGKLIGEKPTGKEQEFKAVFPVPYAPGTLKAIGLRGDRQVAENVLITAGKPTALRVRADRTILQADGQDLSFITVEAVDAKGLPDLHADQEVQFEITGPGTIAAVGNGDGRDPASYQANRRKLFDGRALVVIRSSRQTGPIKVIVRSTGLGDGSLTLDAKEPQPTAQLQ
jgi:beta-galactosidase